ncbi:MAG: hypothetical protein PHF64_00300 [Methanoregula sp.]|nr:hypothetical protein [Methanoregula sp.]
MGAQQAVYNITRELVANSYAERLTAALERAGIASRRIWFGSRSGVATFNSYEAARRAIDLLRQGTFETTAPIESIDYAKENKRTCLLPSTVKVWRVGIRIKH